jgi:hypothetical protein
MPKPKSRNNRNTTPTIRRGDKPISQQEKVKEFQIIPSETVNKKDAVPKSSSKEDETTRSVSKEAKIIIGLTVLGLIIAGVSALGTLTTVPEVRKTVGLELSTPVPSLSPTLNSTPVAIKEDVNLSTSLSNQSMALGLGEYIKLLMLPTDQKEVPWDLAANPEESPIIWKTKGLGDLELEEDKKIIEELNITTYENFTRYRYAPIRVKIKGKVLEKLGENKEEVKWYLTLNGDKFNPHLAIIEPYLNDCFGPVSANCDFDVSTELKSAQIKHTRLCILKRSGGDAVLYYIQAVGKKPAYLTYELDGGSGGHAASLLFEWDAEEIDWNSVLGKTIKNEKCNQFKKDNAYE